MDCRSNICAERWSIVDDVNRSEEDIGSLRTEKEVSEYSRVMRRFPWQDFWAKIAIDEII